MSTTYTMSQKEYLKKYLSGDSKKKKKKKITGGNIKKRSVIVDDDIDLKSMRPLEDDEIELYQMDEDAPQIAGIVDERPPEVKAQEYYSSKRWKVFGGDDGVNVVDSMTKDQHNNGNSLSNLSNTDSIRENRDSSKNNKIDRSITTQTNRSKEMSKKEKAVGDNGIYSSLKDNNYKPSSNSGRHSKKDYNQSDSDESPPRIIRGKSVRSESDSDMSPVRKPNKHSSRDSNVSPPSKAFKKKYDRDHNDSDESPQRKDSLKYKPKDISRQQEKERGRIRNRNHSKSPHRRDEMKKHKYNSDSDSSPRKEKRLYKKEKSDSDASPPRKNDKHNKSVNDTPPRRGTYSFKQEKSDRTDNNLKDKKFCGRDRRGSSSDSDNSPPRRHRKKSPKPGISRKRSPRSRSPSEKYSSHKSRKGYHRDKSPRSSRMYSDERTANRRASDSDNSPPRKSSLVNDRPLKKTLYKPNDGSSSDEGIKSKSKKMKTTLDGKQAGLQDAKELKKELLNLKMKEDTMFSKMDASVSGVGAVPVKRDRNTGQIRDFEKEKEAQKEKEAKESVVNEKYYKWGKGIKQTEDAAVRAAEIMKEMNKPLARYVDDKDLDEFLKAQEREGDPMLDYIKRKQSEATPLQGEKPIYKGSWNPNRFNIRPGYRWDGVVRSNGYEQEWFKTKNAKKARDEEAYKWSTSDM